MLTYSSRFDRPSFVRWKLAPSPTCPSRYVRTRGTASTVRLLSYFAPRRHSTITFAGVYNLPTWLTRKFRTIAGEPIRNYDLVVHMLTLLHLRGQRNGVRFKLVKGHRGLLGNEAADVS